MAGFIFDYWPKSSRFSSPIISGTD